MNNTLLHTIVSAVVAYKNCVKSGNEEWKAKHIERIVKLKNNYLPSGSGFDCGTIVDIEESNDKQLVMYTSFHHMNEHGSYDGWTEHKVIVKPNLLHSIDIKVAGRNKNQIKDYIADHFHDVLLSEGEF